LATGCQTREPYWTEAFAVGGRGWLQAVYQHFGFRRKKILTPLSAFEDESPTGPGVAEQAAVYYIEG